MKQIKVSDIEGEQLAEWAARAQEWVYKETPDDLEYLECGSWYTKNGTFLHIKRNYRPDINSAQAMELAEKFGLQVDFERKMAWRERTLFGYKGETVRIAITRAAIASVYGETVTVEDE